MTELKEMEKFISSSIETLDKKKCLLKFIRDIFVCLNQSALPSRGYEIDLDALSINNVAGNIDIWKNNLVKVKLIISADGIEIQKDHRIAGYIDYTNNVSTCKMIVDYVEEYCK